MTRPDRQPRCTAAGSRRRAPRASRLRPRPRCPGCRSGETRPPGRRRTRGGCRPGSSRDGPASLRRDAERRVSPNVSGAVWPHEAVTCVGHSAAPLDRAFVDDPLPGQPTVRGRAAAGAADEGERGATATQDDEQGSSCSGEPAAKAHGIASSLWRECAPRTGSSVKGSTISSRPPPSGSIVASVWCPSP